MLLKINILQHRVTVFVSLIILFFSISLEAKNVEKTMYRFANASTEIFLQNTKKPIANSKLSAKETKKLQLFRQLIAKNKKSLSQVFVFYIVNQFLLTYILKNNDKSVYPFLKNKSLLIDGFFAGNEDFMKQSDKYFRGNDLHPAYKYIPIILSLHEKEDKADYVKANGEKMKSKGKWMITDNFFKVITYGNDNKEKIDDLSDTKATIFMGKYFSDRFNDLQQNIYYVIVEFLTRKNEKNILKDILKDGHATNISDIEEYLDAKDRIKIREFLAIYFYDIINNSPTYDFSKDKLIIDILKKNPEF